MGARCPNCYRITSATKSGLYTCIGCSRKFRVGPPIAIVIGIRARISQLEAVKEEIEAASDRWLSLEARILEQELADLQEALGR